MAMRKIALFASAALVCGVGLAKAQDYGPYRPYYGDDPYAPPSETVIVHPDYDTIEKRTVTGRVGGEVNPTEYTVSRPVSFSDLDLSRGADYIELRERIRATARDLCLELDERVPQLRGDESADRECVRNATRDAMRDVMERYG
jgi:UrcA family protein